MRYTSKTIEREVTGPFTGKRFPSMSDDVVDALLTIEYRFEGFTITVVGIPARWDRTLGAEYVTGKVGREVNERVTTLAAILVGQLCWGSPFDAYRGMIGQCVRLSSHEEPAPCPARRTIPFVL